MIGRGPAIPSLFSRSALVPLLLLLARHGNAASPEFTIHEVMRAPYPSDLVAAPKDSAVAWVFDEEGRRNVWIADAANGTRARALTAYTEDDGSHIGELAWSPDAAFIAYTRGGTLDNERPANVDSSPEGPLPREVWIVRTAGSEPRKLGEGHAARFSPDGDRLVYLDKDRIWIAPVARRSAPAPLIVDLGRIAAVRWSPDGKRLAFVSDRGRHRLIGVYDFVSRAIVWASPGFDRDGSPAFSPDGAQIAFIREPSVKSPAYVSRSSGPPWSIWIADARTGEGRRIWRADPGPGSVFHPTLSSENLFWTVRDELIFPWEKTGWLQLHAVSIRSGAVQALTAGQFEVAHVVLSPDRRRLVYSSNEGDSDRLHLWSVAPGRRPSRLAETRAIEDFPQVAADGTVFALQSKATKPLQPVMLKSGRWQPLAPQAVPASFPSAKLVLPESVTFAAKDGQLAHGQIFVPPDGAAARPRPAIMFFHGGPRRQMLLGFHPMSAYNRMYALNQFFIARGYVVLAINFRGGIGYGLDYREAPGFGPGGASELNDLLGAITYLRSRRDVDAARLGIWGGSYGGLMTALGLARASDAIAAGVSYAGVFNWVSLLSSVGTPVEPGVASRLAFESSPAATVDQWRSPVLIVQADDDRNVPPSQASELIEQLRARQVEHEVINLPNEVHDLARHASWLRLFEAADAFFERHLLKDQPRPMPLGIAWASQSR